MKQFDETIRVEMKVTANQVDIDAGELARSTTKNKKVEKFANQTWLTRSRSEPH